MKVSDKIYVAGHRGMVGNAIVHKLKELGFTKLLLRSSSELDLKNTAAVKDFFEEEKPDYVFLAAAKVGGILANKQFKADFIYDNLMIQSNVIHQCYLSKVKKLLFLGSSCIYPKLASQPIKEEYLLTGKLEESNDAYAIAKIAGVKMCEAYNTQYGCNFISVMPTNLYGPNDNYDLKNSHVLPALLKKMIIAKQNNDDTVTIWGSGKPKREFLHVDDLADACFFLMLHYNESTVVNIGTGKDISITELAYTIRKIIGFKGSLKFDLSKPDGTPRKLLDVSKLNKMGWVHSIELEEGILLTLADYLQKNKSNQSTLALSNIIE